MFTEAGVGPDPAALLEELEEAGLAAVRDRGEATTADLTALDPRLGQRITLARGKSYEATISVSQKVFFHLALDGKIGRGRPLGTWIGSQFRWSPIERWLPDGIAEMPVDDARAELVRRWLAGLRARHTRRHQVVDRLDGRRHDKGPDRGRGRRGGPGRGRERLRAPRRR